MRKNHKVKLFDGKKAAEGADIALKARLYVSGWALSGELSHIRDMAANNPLWYTVALSYKKDVPVAVVIRDNLMLQAFCRVSERRNGHAAACVRAIKKRHPDICTHLNAAVGAAGSEHFWKHCMVRAD